MANNKPTLYMEMGLPRSGKSTHARSLNMPIVCPDAIRLSLHGERFIASAEPMVWAIARYMVRSLFKAGHSAVVLDACNTTAKRRDEWIDDDWVRVLCIHETHSDICGQRACRTGRVDLLPVIARMANQWETPDLASEFFSDVIRFGFTGKQLRD